MTVSRVRSAAGRNRADSLIDLRPLDPQLGFKLRPPALRRGLVERSSLLDRLQSAGDARVVTIVAPAGYGKTTLLAQWCNRERRPTAWLTLERDDNDPAALLSTIALALHRVGLTDSSALAGVRLTSDTIVTEGVARLTAAIESDGTPGLLMLDHAESVRGRGANDVIAELAAKLPDSLQLVVASRTAVRLPIGELRSRGALLEVTPSDLRMTDDEARILIEATGVEVGEDLPVLMERTEGWPVGLYLVALAIAAGAPRDAALEIRGDDRFIADYLRQEVLGRLSEARVSFLTRTSILTRLSGPLCDAVLDTTGSARTLDALEGSNLLIIPLDRTRDWYRYHHLMRDLLQADLARRDPAVVAELHARAATWLEANGMAESAIAHAQAAEDFDAVARLVSRLARVTFASGRADTVFGWLHWLEQSGDPSGYPELAATGSLGFALMGRTDDADRWAAAVFRSPGGGEVADDDLPPIARFLRALNMPSGPLRMRGDAQAARRGLASAPEWLGAAICVEALAFFLDGELERADSLYAESISTVQRVVGFPTETLALAGRAAIAAGHADWDLAADLTESAETLIRTHHLERYATSALALTVAARVARHRGDVDRARRLLSHAALTRPLLSHMIPAVSIHARLEMARGYLELSDVAGARQMLREISDILAKRPDVGVLVTEYDAMRQHLSGMPAGPVGTSALTSAELRLLPLLVTHLSFPEIGERLYVSRHTVKTQAMSIYRKLGVSSRSEAVTKARETGLLSI